MARSTAPCGLALAWLVLMTGPVAAQEGLLGGLRTILDTNVSAVSTTITDASGNVSTTRTNSLFPRLTVNAETLLYPSLRLATGGVFEVNRATLGQDLPLVGTGPGGTASTASSLRPFFELRSTSATFAPGVAYYRRENRNRTAGAPGLTLVSQDYVGYLLWRPSGLPQTDFRLMRTNTHDATRTTEDSTKDLGSILSRYVYKDLSVNYQGSFLGTTVRTQSLETNQVSNAVRVDHSKSFLAKRLLWNGTYNVNHQSTRTTARADGGEVAFPVVPFSALSGVSDTPQTASLTANPLLVDGNLAASAGIDLGVQGPGPDSQARNLGLDFSSPTEVNRLLVWVDRELPANIANAFSWEIYSSTDNITWRRDTVVPLASFGLFENRFQIDFTPLAARYLKVVTRPLSAAVLDSSRFPDIFVTELQAFRTRPVDEARGTIARTTQVVNTDVRLRLLDAPLVHYEGSYWLNDAGASGRRRSTISNGVSVLHRFSPAVTAFGRGAVEQGTQPEGHRVAAITNGTLTYSPLRTFSGSVLFTGQNESIAGRPNDRTGLMVQTTTQLYRGIDILFGCGWNVATLETGEHSRNRTVNISGSVVPRQNLALTFSLVESTLARSGTFAGHPRLHTRSAFLTLAVDPIRTLHLVLAEEATITSGARSRVTHNVGATWNPFQDGSLQFLVSYNESLRSLEFGTDRVFREGVRWTFSRPSYVDISYSRIRSEFVFQKTDSKILSVDLKIFL